MTNRKGEEGEREREREREQEKDSIGYGSLSQNDQRACKKW